jgi:hypothetical protein
MSEVQHTFEDIDKWVTEYINHNLESQVNLKIYEGFKFDTTWLKTTLSDINPGKCSATKTPFSSIIILSAL